MGKTESTQHLIRARKTSMLGCPNQLLFRPALQLGPPAPAADTDRCRLLLQAIED